MAKPLQGGIAKQVLKAMKGAKMLVPATLVKVTAGTRVPGTYSGGTNPTTASYAAQGFIDDFSAKEIDGTLILVGDRRVVLMGASIAGGKQPVADDKITIAGATYRVRSVASDPANATFVCAAYGAATT